MKKKPPGKLIFGRKRVRWDSANYVEFERSISFGGGEYKCE
jgi:hypothetical protein